MKEFLIVLLLFLIVTSCSSQEAEKERKNASKHYDSIAVELNNKAMELSFQSSADSVTEKALSYLSQSIQKDSSYYMAYANMASLYLKQGKRDSAINILQSIIDRKPYYAEGLSIKGYIYDKLGQQDSAKIEYKQAMKAYDIRIEEDKNNVDAKVNKAFLMLFLYDREVAFREVEKILEEHPDNSFALKMKNDIIPYFNKEEFLSSY